MYKKIIQENFYMNMTNLPKPNLDHQNYARNEK